MYSARFDPSGKRIVYVDAKGRVAVRDLALGARGDARRRPGDRCTGAQFSPDGEHVAAIPGRGDVLIWRRDRWSRPERAFKAHRGDVNTLAYGPDGRLITGGTDRTVRIWDPRGGAPVVLRGHEDEITTAVFTADGTRVLTLEPGRHPAPLGRAQRRSTCGAAVRSGRDLRRCGERDGKIATLGKGEVVRVFTLRCLRQPRRRAGARALSRSPSAHARERGQFLAAAG